MEREISHSTVKKKKVIKIVITRKLIAPFLDQTVTAFRENPVKKRHDSISSSSFQTLSLSIFYTHANRHLICILMISLLLFSHLSEPSIKLCATRSLWRRRFFFCAFLQSTLASLNKLESNQPLQVPVQGRISEQVYCAYITGVL